MGNEKFDANPVNQITPAALALSKSVETALAAVGSAVQGATTANSTSTTLAIQDVAKIQETVTVKIAEAIAALPPATATATLTNVTTLATTVGTATQAAATAISTAQNTTVVVADVAAVATAVQTAVTTVATTIATTAGTSTASMGTTANTKVSEQSIVQQIVPTLQAAVTVAADTAVQSIATAPTVVDSTPPAVSSTIPANAAVDVPVGAIVSIKLTKEMDPTTITGTTFFLKDDVTTTTVAATVTYNCLTNTAILTPTAPLVAGRAYTATFTTGAKDLSAKLGLAGNQTWGFTTAAAPDLTPPTYTIVPADLATNVATADAVQSVPTPIVATFNKDVTSSTVNTTNFTVVPAGGTALAGVVRYDVVSKKATFLPALPLKNGTVYTVTLGGITSLSGGVLPATSTTFTTVAPSDTTRPTATLATNPATAGTIPVTAAFTATFSEAIDTATLNTTTFSVKFTSDNSAIAGSVLWNGVTKTASFVPATVLPNNRKFTVTLTSGIKDLAGNLLVPPTPVIFTTDPLPANITGASGSSSGAAF